MEPNLQNQLNGQINNSNNGLSQKIDDLIALTKENNELLRKVRRTQQIAQITRVFYWIVIIGLAFGSFYFLQPYLESLKGLYGGAGTSAIPDIGHVKALIDLYK